MRNIKTRRASPFPISARRHVLLLALVAVPLLAAQAAEPRELPRARPEEVGISSERLRRVDDVVPPHIHEKKNSGGVPPGAPPGGGRPHQGPGPEGGGARGPERQGR